jgi:hypothetical protein
MARRVFFSFDYAQDIHQVMQIRNAWKLPATREASPLVDKAEFERLKRTGDIAVRNWIDRQMSGCGVLCVLIGPTTYSRRWVRYEIAKAHLDGMGILGVSLAGMRALNGWETKSNGPNPFNYLETKKFGREISYPVYSWVNGQGRTNIGQWVETAAKNANR